MNGGIYMLKKKFRKVLPGLLTTAMVFSMTAATPLTAQADAQTNVGNTHLEFTKTLNVINGLLLNNDGETGGELAYDFVIAPATVEANTTISGLPLKSGVALDTDDATVTATFDNSDYKTDSSGKYALKKTEITKDVYFDFTNVEFPTAGVYRYNVYEDTSDNFSWMTYDSHDGSEGAVFTVDVYVLDTENAMNIQSYVVYDNDEKEPLEFYNEWNCGDLQIKKVVPEGKGNTNAAFNFKLTIPAPGDTIDLPEGGYINASVKSSTGSVVTDVTLEVGDDGTEFSLKNGQYLEIESLPQGMIYTVEELGATDYTTTVQATDDEGTLQSAGTTKTYNGTITLAGSSSAEGIADNQVVFTNERNITVDSGIVLNIAPYVVVLILAVGGAVVFFARKKNSAK
jgi:pilin isopeptide linkage protein